MRAIIAGTAIAAVAFGGCAAGSTDATDGLSAVETRLSLSTGDILNTLTYTITGNGVTRTDDVDVSNSTRILFQVGDLPLGTGYTMDLTGTTVGGFDCTGSAPFDIADNGITGLTMALDCGGGTAQEADVAGDVRVESDVVIIDDSCPVLQGASALPANVTVGNSVDLTAYLGTAPAASVAWATNLDGTFGAGDALATDYTCESGGDKTLTVTVTGTGNCPADSLDVVVECVGAGSLVEICQGGNDEDGDGDIDCADTDCFLNPICATAEVCDDGSDNDLDGDVDCADADCSTDFAACPQAEVCSGGLDEDNDGLVDCADVIDCPDTDPACAPGTETSCTDGVDNDLDGDIDCADSECAGSAACVETACADGVDNDNDGDVDCADADCAGDAACDLCGQCFDTNCAGYIVPNLADACFNGADTLNPTVPDNLPGDPAFSQLCTDAYQCTVDAIAAGTCSSPSSCACGATRSLTDCQASGPAADAACSAEWISAVPPCYGPDNTPNTTDDDWQCAGGLFSDATYASGYVIFAIECVGLNCATECY